MGNYKFWELLVIDDYKIAVIGVEAFLEWGCPIALIYHVHDDGRIEHWYTGDGNSFILRGGESSLLSRGRVVGWKIFEEEKSTNINYPLRSMWHEEKERTVITIKDIDRKGYLISSEHKQVPIQVQKPHLHIIGENQVLLFSKLIEHSPSAGQVGMQTMPGKMAACQLDPLTSEVISTYYFPFSMSQQEFSVSSWNKEYYVLAVDKKILVLSLITNTVCATFIVGFGKIEFIKVRRNLVIQHRPGVGETFLLFINGGLSTFKSLSVLDGWDFSLRNPLQNVECILDVFLRTIMNSFYTNWIVYLIRRLREKF